MRVVFFGSHQYSLYPLQALYKDGYKICAVFTQPDRPVGRHQELTPTPVKKWALPHKIPLFTSLLRCKAISPSRCNSFAPDNIDLGIVCVYGEIIPKELLSLPKYGFLNIHPSLLPKYRGASPVQAAIVLGEKETGVTIFLMDEKIDHGPIICQEKEEIKKGDTAESLSHRLFQKGGNLLINILGKISSQLKTGPKKRGRAKWGQVYVLKPQDDSRASYTRRLKRDNGFIPWEFVKSAIDGKNLNQKINVDFIKDSQKRPFYILHSTFYIHNLIHALSPWPGVWSNLKLRTKNLGPRTKRVKLLKAHIKDRKLILDKVQLEGEEPIAYINLQSLILANA